MHGLAKADVVFRPLILIQSLGLEMAHRPLLVRDEAIFAVFRPDAKQNELSA